MCWRRRILVTGDVHLHSCRMEVLDKQKLLDSYFFDTLLHTAQVVTSHSTCSVKYQQYPLYVVIAAIVIFQSAYFQVTGESTPRTIYS